MKKTVIVVAVLVAIGLAAYFASPLLAVHSFTNAARSGDPDRLEADVDFPAVRDSLRSQVNAAMVSRMQGDPELKNNPFAGLGLAIAPMIVDRLVDTIVTPDGIAALVRQGKVQAEGKAAPPTAEPINYSYEYLAIDRFRVTLKSKAGEDAAKLVFERRGIFSWKLVKIELPAAALSTAAPAAAAPSSLSAAPAPTPPAVEPAVSFALPTLPTPVTQTQCHMGECVWQQILSVEDVRRVGGDLLRIVHSRIGITETPDGQDYPSSLGPGVKVQWRNDTSYDLCSTSRPTSVSWDTDTKTYLVTPLNVIDPAGYEISAVAEYTLVCHGVTSTGNSGSDPQMSRLGYVEPGQTAQQSHIDSPDQVFTAVAPNSG